MRRKQQEDVSRIYSLAVAGVGEITAAVVLASRLPGIETLEQASSFARRDPGTTGKLFGKELYFQWIEESFLNIQNALSQINFERIAAYDGSKQDTKPIFEKHISETAQQITDSTTGIFYSLRTIFENDSSYAHKQLPASALEALNEANRRAKEILGLCNRVLHPYRYVLTDRRLIVAFVVAFLCAIPLWYLFRTSAFGPTGSLADIPNNANLGTSWTGYLANGLAIAKSLWQLYLAVPSILLVPAVLLGIARKYFQVTALNSAYLKRYEATLRDAALEFQRYLPNPPSFPLFTIKELNMSTGDINIIKGDNNTQIVKSMVEGSFNQVKGKHGGDIDRFLEEVGKKVIESKNPQAAKLYEKFNSELIETPPTGSILKGIWDGLLKVLPAVGEIVGAAEAILKLTSD